MMISSDDEMKTARNRFMNSRNREFRKFLSTPSAPAYLMAMIRSWSKPQMRYDPSRPRLHRVRGMQCCRRVFSTGPVEGGEEPLLDNDSGEGEPSMNKRIDLRRHP